MTCAKEFEAIGTKVGKSAGLERAASHAVTPNSTGDPDSCLGETADVGLGRQKDLHSIVGLKSFRETPFGVGESESAKSDSFYKPIGLGFAFKAQYLGQDGENRLTAIHLLARANTDFFDAVSGRYHATTATLPVGIFVRPWTVGDLPSAEREWKAAIAVNSRLGEAHNNLAALYAMTGRKQQAQESVRQAERSGYQVNPRLKSDIQALAENPKPQTPNPKPQS